MTFLEDSIKSKYSVEVVVGETLMLYDFSKEKFVSPVLGEIYNLSTASYYRAKNVFVKNIAGVEVQKYRLLKISNDALEVVTTRQ